MDGIRMVEVPGYSNGWIAASGGQYVRIIDIEGCQVGDLFAVSQSDHDEFMSPSVTRLHNGNLFPETGQCFFTNRDRPVFTFIADASPGRHDMLYASCNRDWYASRGLKDHPNCRDNYFEAAGDAGIGNVLQPDPVNLFQNTPPDADGRFVIGDTLSAAGDHVTLRAEIDCIVILTACSSERIVGGRSTPLLIEVHDHDPEQASPAC